MSAVGSEADKATPGLLRLLTQSRHKRPFFCRSATCAALQNLLCLPLYPGAEPMRRRDFIVAMGVAFAWSPSVSRGQQAEQTRRIGILMNRAADDTEGQAGIAAFQQALQQLGWKV